MIGMGIPASGYTDAVVAGVDIPICDDDGMSFKHIFYK